MSDFFIAQVAGQTGQTEVEQLRQQVEELLKELFGATFVDLTWLISMVGTLASKKPTLDPR